MSSPRSRPRALVSLAVVFALVLAACGGGGGDDDAAPSTTSTTKRTTTTAPAPTAPLTGTAQPDGAKLSRPALLIKVDNTPKGIGVQEGIEKADVVFVEQTEQGTTRLAAVYQSQDAVVGPVRSARTSDIGIAGALNNPLLAYSGANRVVLQQVRRGPLVDFGIDASGATPVYLRNQRGSSRNLYRYFLPTSEVYEAKGGEGGTPPSLFDYRSDGEDAAGEPARGVRIGYGGRAATVVTYAWDAALGGWARTQNGRPHQMAGGGPRLAPPNVVVLITPYRDSGFRDVTGAASPEAVLEGSGAAWFLTDGKVIRGRWARPTATSEFSFTTDAGGPAEVTPGQTFVELAPGAGSAAIL